MKSYAALLRAVNVGGTGKLAMADLRALCERCGFQEVSTYIQSGNVVFRSGLPRARVRTALEKALEEKLGKPVAVLLRDLTELRAIVQRNPFPDAAANRLLILFLETAPPKNSLDDVVVPGTEQLALHGKEVYIHYPDGMGRSKLKLPFQAIATGRNLNTVNKLISMLAALE